MDAARKGIVTPELKTVAKKEYMEESALMALVAQGKAVIPANKKHKCLNPEGVGSMLRTKINVNLGVSRDCTDYNVEMQKVMSAVDMGAEAIMDLSSQRYQPSAFSTALGIASLTSSRAFPCSRAA